MLTFNAPLLRKLRHHFGLSLHDVSKMSGLSSSVIQKLELGLHMNPSLETIYLLSTAFNINPIYFVLIPKHLELTLNNRIAEEICKSLS